jgi:hypothetical protein
MPQIHIVAPGYYLHLPANVDEFRGCWLRPGGVLDLEDPYIADAVKGQEYKLVPAGEGDPQTPDPLPNERMRIVREQFLGTYKAPKTDEEEITERAENAARDEQLTDDIPEPVLTLPRAKGKKGK